MVTPEAQYRETYERQRQHDRFIWQTPTITVVVDGALIATTFGLVNSWLIREFILIFAFIITIILTLALYKHRYFSDVDEETLIGLEKQHAQKHIQRMSSPVRRRKGYWGEKFPKGLQKWSAGWIFFYAMISICIILFIMLFINPAVGDTIPLTSANMSQTLQ